MIDITQGQGPPELVSPAKPKFAWCGLWAIGAALVFVPGYLLAMHFKPPATPYIPLPIGEMIRIRVLQYTLSMGPSVVAYFLAMRALRQIRRGNGKVEGTAMAIFGLTLALFGAGAAAWTMRNFYGPRDGPNESIQQARIRVDNLAQPIWNYAYDHQGHYPQDLAELVTNLRVDPAWLVDPGTGTAALAKRNDWPDWHDEAAEVRAHCDYFYTGGGLVYDPKSGVGDNAKLILLYSKKSRHGAGRIVMFGVGYPYFITEDKMPEYIAQYNVQRGKIGLKPIVLDEQPLGADK